MTDEFVIFGYRALLSCGSQIWMSIVMVLITSAK